MKYKTWELLKMAEEYDGYATTRISERPVFTCPQFGKITFFKGVGYTALCDLKGDMLTGSIPHSNVEWEQVHEPVPFMEAVKAYYNDGKQIWCKYNGDVVSYTIPNLFISPKYILGGTWYIKL